MNAKQPLPATPFTVQPDEESTAVDQESLPATPSTTELVSLMEQLQIAPSVARSSDYLSLSQKMTPMLRNRYSSPSHKVWENKFKLRPL